MPMPSAPLSSDYIYSILRAPWHAAPFVNRDSFLTSWLPGCVLAGGMLAGALAIAGTAMEPRLRATARWLVLLLAYLFAALALSYLDRRTGILGKFYLFRPSSLVLLIWLVTAMAWLNELAPRRPALLKLAAAALVVPPFVAAAALHLRQGVSARVEIASKISCGARRPQMPSSSSIPRSSTPSWISRGRRAGSPSSCGSSCRPTIHRSWSGTGAWSSAARSFSRDAGRTRPIERITC